jgi:hypothetical protein
MKKIMITLLMAAATLNAMATISDKAKVTLTSSDNKKCEAVIAISDEFIYASLNDENKEVLVYVEYEGERYAHFGSSTATMTDMPLVIKTNSATAYKFSFSQLVGSIDIYDKKEDVIIDKSKVYNFTIDESETNTVIADRFVINYSLPVSVTPSICFTNNILEIKGHAGETLKVEKDGVAVVAEAPLATDNESFDFSAYTGRMVVTLNGQEYHIDANLK